MAQTSASALALARHLQGAPTIYWGEAGPTVRAEMGIADGLVRVSVGLESADELIADFSRALD